MKILTWNMQGGDGVSDKQNLLGKLLGGNDYDVICLQECTSVLGSFERSSEKEMEKEKSIGKPKLQMFQTPTPLRSGLRKRNGMKAFYYPWSPSKKNYRCSMITYVKDELDVSSYCSIKSPIINHRGALVVYAGEWAICNIHLVSGKSVDAFGEFIYFQKRLPENKNVIIVGDFNIDLRNTKNEKTIGGILPNLHYESSMPVASTKRLTGSSPISETNNQIVPTHANDTLDYLYYRGERKITAKVLFQYGAYSDHLPVEFEII